MYEGPRRALRKFLEAIEKDRDAIITDLEVAIENASKELGESDLKQLAKRILFEFVGMFTFAFLFKTSTSVASVHLRDVSHKLVREKETLAYKLIELEARLDSPTELPFEEIDKLSESTNRNILAHRILEAIVLPHLYLFKTTDQEKQRLCGILGVSMERQRAIDIQSKHHKIIEKK
jgi:hypothetical protein